MDKKNSVFLKKNASGGRILYLQKFGLILFTFLRKKNVVKNTSSGIIDSELVFFTT